MEKVKVAQATTDAAKLQLREAKHLSRNGFVAIELRCVTDLTSGCCQFAAISSDASLSMGRSRSGLKLLRRGAQNVVNGHVEAANGLIACGISLVLFSDSQYIFLYYISRNVIMLLLPHLPKHQTAVRRPQRANLGAAKAFV